MLPPSASYWDSSEAMSLFPSQPTETEQDCGPRQIERLKLAYNDWSKLVDILDGGEGSLEELTDYLKQKLVQKCLYLCRAYQAALRTMDNGTNWSVCCQMAIDEIANLEITTYLGVQTIRGLNQKI